MKILIVDDHALFRAGMRLLLSGQHRHFAIFEAATSEGARVLLSEHPDIALCLLDLSLAKESGLEALRTLKAAAPHVAFVVVSATCHVVTVRACLQAGAMSYVPKSMPADALLQALKQVIAGRIYLPREVLNLVQAPSSPPALSPRQFDVLRGLARGLPTKVIAHELQISESTAKEHVGAVFTALGVRNRTEAVICAGRLGLLGTPFN